MKKPILESDRTSIYAAMSEDDGKILNEDANIYAAMLDDEDEELDTQESNKQIKAPFGAKTSVPVMHEGHIVDAASLAYVKTLERAIQQQKMEIRKLDRMVKTLGFMVRNQRDHANQASRTISDLRREVDNKIDRRD